MASIKLTFLLCISFSIVISYQNSENERKRDVSKKYLTKLKKKEGNIILRNGRNPYEGNVEIFHSGVWGSICDDEWDIQDATVVCRQLGFKGVRKITHSSFFGSTADRFWMDNLFCTGEEKYLHQCHFEGWGLNDCDKTEVAGVTCDATADVNSTSKMPIKKSTKQIKDVFGAGLQIRLLGGRVPEEGRMEIKYKNSDWGVICGHGWSILEAMVACRSLGLNYAGYAAQTNFFGGNSSNMILSGIRCRGYETDLQFCNIEVPYTGECLGKRDQIAGVVCTSRLPDLMIDTEELERSSYIEDRQLHFLQCAMEENCLASTAYRIQREKKVDWHLETRRLLRFTAKITNVGNVEFRPYVPKYQWEFHQCHMHYHSMEIFATFDIEDQGNNKVAEGHKASFCLEDNQCTMGAEPVFACADYGEQGISVNCSDIYRHDIDCQWIDISELNFGLYTFKVVVNPEFKVAEMTYSNNMAVCSMYYTETFVKIHNCFMQHP